MHPLLGTTSNIPHMTPEPWTPTLCIVGSQLPVCPPQQPKIPAVHVSHWETSFVLFNCTHICTLAHTHREPIQQPSSHLVCPLVPLWHCLWNHVHLVLPCLPPLAAVPITHIMSPLHSLCSSFFPSPHIPLHSHSSGCGHPSPLRSIVLTMTYCSLFPAWWTYCTHYTDSSTVPPSLWMKLCMSD